MQNANAGRKRLVVQDTSIIARGTLKCSTCLKTKPHNKTNLKTHCRNFVYVGENNRPWYGKVCNSCRLAKYRLYKKIAYKAKKAAMVPVVELLGPKQPEFVAIKRPCKSCGVKTVNYRYCPQCNIQDDGIVSHTDLNSYGRL